MDKRYEISCYMAMCAVVDPIQYDDAVKSEKWRKIHGCGHGNTKEWHVKSSIIDRGKKES